MDRSSLPPVIGICGFPTHGKSTAQRFLELLGVEARDDGDILREAVAKEFNLTWEDVTTQEGKLKVVPGINGEPTQVRKLLGEWGNVLEAQYGERIIAKLAIKKLLEERKGDLRPASFGSVRKSQGWAYKEAGGLMIEVLDPRKPVGQLYAFDEFDRDCVDVQIINDSSVIDLGTRVMMAVSEYLNLDGAAAHHALGAFALELELAA